jgi:hypothetical protein
MLGISQRGLSVYYMAGETAENRTDRCTIMPVVLMLTGAVFIHALFHNKVSHKAEMCVCVQFNLHERRWV